MKLRAFVLARNEEVNIRACLAGLANLGAPIHVLDSHSSDATARIASSFPGVSVAPYRYVDHATAYNEISETHPGGDADYAMVVDADMVISPSLGVEVLGVLQSTCPPAVISAPVLMYWNGRPLWSGSLYPPKPLVFKTGSRYFIPRGHGEALRPDVIPVMTRNRLIHDDRKPYAMYLASQARYADALAQRFGRRDLSWSDRIRTSSPLMVLATPLVSYLIRGGILSGKTGAIYAIDRLIAEAIMFRRMLARAQDNESSPGLASEDPP